MDVHFKITGILLILLSLLHLFFPAYFNWKKELSSLSLINRQMMVVHTLFVALIVLLMGLLCLTSSHDLLYTTLGNRISLGLGIFWAIRLCIQFVGHSSTLWKGKRFETTIHILFALLWTYVSAVFIWTYLV